MSIRSRLFGNKHEYTTDTPEQMRANIAAGKAVMLDVRSQEEREEGYLAGSIFIPITDIKTLPEGTTELDGLDKSKIIYCH